LFYTEFKTKITLLSLLCSAFISTPCFGLMINFKTLG